MRAFAVSALVVLAAAVLAGCGQTPAQPGERQPSPSPTGACPSVEHQPLPDDCVGYDPDAGMRANDAYRQRGDLPADMRDDAVEHRDTIVAALATAAAAGPLTAQQARDLLVPLGYESVQAYGSSDVGGGLALGVSTGSGCVYGGVRGAEVTLEVGGGIADGGCLPAEGH